MIKSHLETILYNNSIDYCFERNVNLVRLFQYVLMISIYRLLMTSSLLASHYISHLFIPKNYHHHIDENIFPTVMRSHLSLFVVNNLYSSFDVILRL